MRIKFATFVRDGGDGSVSTTILSSEEEANKLAEKDEEMNGYCMEGAVEVHEIEVDDDGKFVKVII